MSVPKPGQYGEPLVADIRTGCYAIYPESRGHENCLAGADRWALVYQDGRGEKEPGIDYPLLSEEQRAFALRIVSCLTALNGRDPEALRELEDAAQAAERLLRRVLSAEEEIRVPRELRVVRRLRAALKAFGVES